MKAPTTPHVNDNGERKPAFTWLHVSDWHFKDAREEEYNRVLNQVVRCIGKTINNTITEADKDKKCNHFDHIDCIIHTGDLAYSGKAGEYEEAQKALAGLMRNLNVKTEQVIITPGNHDVTNSLAFYPSELSRFLNDGEYVTAEEQWFGRHELLEILLKRFDEFHGFKRKYGYPNSSEEKDGYFIQKVTLNNYNINIAIAAINSAVVSTRYDYEEKAELFLGQRRVQKVAKEIIRQYKDAELRLLIFHHPFSYLNARDALRCWEIIEDKFDVVLYGHKHSERDVMEHLTQISGFPALDSGSISLIQRESSWEVEAANFTVGQYYPPQSDNSEQFSEVQFIHFAVIKSNQDGFRFHMNYRPKEGHGLPEKITPITMRLTHPHPKEGQRQQNKKKLCLIEGTTDLGCHETQSSAIVDNFYRQRNASSDFIEDRTLILPTKHFFWHVESRMLFHCMATHPDYWLRQESKKIFDNEKDKIVAEVINLARGMHLRIACLGIGEGNKEITLFREIKSKRPLTDETSLIFVDINYQMILRAARYMDISGHDFAFVNTDFDSLTIDHIISSRFYQDRNKTREIILFIMLGNTFANQFESSFLNRLSGLQANGIDILFLFDVPLIETPESDKNAYASNEGREFSELTVRHFDKRYEKKWRLKDPKRIDAGKQINNMRISDVEEAITVSNLVNSPTFGNLWLGMSHRYNLIKLKEFLAASGWEIKWDSEQNSAKSWYALIRPK